MRAPRLDMVLITLAFGWPRVVLCHTATRVFLASTAGASTAAASATGRVRLAGPADSATPPLAPSQFSFDQRRQPPSSGFSAPAQVAH